MAIELILCKHCSVKGQCSNIMLHLPADLPTHSALTSQSSWMSSSLLTAHITSGFDDDLRDPVFSFRQFQTSA